MKFVVFHDVAVMHLAGRIELVLDHLQYHINSRIVQAKDLDSYIAIVLILGKFDFCSSSFTKSLADGVFSI